MKSTIIAEIVALFIIAAAVSGLAAEDNLREDHLTFSRGKSDAVELMAGETAGQFFQAPARFDTVFVQFHHVVGRYVKAQLALYGPLDNPDDLSTLEQEEITSKTFQLQDDGQLDDGKWLVLYFKPQPAGLYCWKLMNPESRGVLGCYARKQSDYSDGHALLRDKHTYWMDMCSAFGYYGVDVPLTLPDPDPAADQRLSSERFWGGFIYSKDNAPPGWDSELQLLRNLGLVNLKTKADRKIAESLSEVKSFEPETQYLRTDSAEQLELLARMLGDKESGACVTNDPFFKADTPERLEMLRWLMLRHLDDSLGFSIGDYSDYRPLNADQFRRPHAGYVAARVPQNSKGHLVRLKRELRAWSELGALMRQAPPIRKPDILVVLDDDDGPLLANSAIIPTQDFLNNKPKSLKPFQAIVITGEVRRGMMKRLEKFVAGGGRVVFALPDNAGDLPSNPLTHALQWNENIPQAARRLVMHEEYNDPVSWTQRTMQFSVTLGKKIGVQDGMLGVAPYGSKADLFYEFVLPTDSHALEVDVEYRAWDRHDIAWIGWAQDGKIFRWLDVPQKRRTTNRWSGVFRNQEDLPHEKLYLHFLIMNRDQTRAEDDYKGAALEDLQVYAIQDPLFRRRQAELNGRAWTLEEVGPYWTTESDKVKTIGVVKTQGGLKYPLALTRKQGWRGGAWTLINAPDALAPQNTGEQELLDAILSAVLKRYQAPDRRLSISRGSNYLAAVKALDVDPLEDVEFSAPAPADSCVVFDVFARGFLPCKVADDDVYFTDDLTEPYASRLYFIKSAMQPVLLMTDGNLSRAAGYGDGDYNQATKTLSFECAREAWVYSSKAPISVRNLDGLDLRHDWNEKSGLLYIQTPGEYGKVVGQFN